MLIKKYIDFINESIKVKDTNLYDLLMTEFGIGKNQVTIYKEDDNTYTVEVMDIAEFEDEYGDNIMYQMTDLLNNKGIYKDGIEGKNRSLNDFNDEIKRGFLSFNINEIEDCLSKLKDYDGCDDNVVAGLLDNDATVGYSPAKVAIDIPIKEFRNKLKERINTKFTAEIFKDYELLFEVRIDIDKKELKQLLGTISVCNESCEDIYLSYKSINCGNDKVILIYIHKL